MGWDAEQRDQAEHPDPTGKLPRCQLHCWEDIHPFTTLVFHPLQPEWGDMLGFCICNWGRTDGGGTVGSNTAIKIIYTACNSPSRGDRGGPASAPVPTQAAGRGSFCCWDILVGFDGFDYFPSPGVLFLVLLLKRFEEPTAEPELLPRGGI